VKEDEMVLRWGGKFFTRTLPMLPFILFTLFPFYYMGITALKSDQELYDLKAVPFWISRGITGEHFAFLFRETLFTTWVINTVIVSLLTTLISVMISILAAHSLARLKFKGGNSFAMAIFITYLVPPTLLFLPLTEVVHKLGLSDSIWALVVTYPTFLVPFSTWLLMGYFKTIPREIEECAMIDGCSRFQTLFRIVLPTAIPGIICVVLFAFTISWNEFLYSLTFISTSENKTVIVGVVGELIRGDVYYWGSLMAGAVVGALPIVILFAFFMDYFVSGLTAGAIK
jgi:multiple sugar transport system permease protein